MAKKAMGRLTLKFLLVIALGMAFFGCEATDNKTLQINAYAPKNQVDGGHTIFMTHVTAARFGIFEPLEGGLSYSDRHTVEFDSDDLASGELNLEKVADLPSNVDDGVFIVEGFGKKRVPSTRLCGNTDNCETGWKCEGSYVIQGNISCATPAECTGYDPNAACEVPEGSDGTQKVCVGQGYCVRQMENAAIARGISAPTDYSSQSDRVVDVLFGMTLDFAITTKPDGNSALLNTKRAFHGAQLLTDGKIIHIGGETSLNSPLADAELFHPSNNTFKSLSLSWQGGRSRFAMHPVASLSKPDSLGNDYFVIVGGRVSQDTQTNEVYLGKYNPDDESVTLAQIDSGSMEPIEQMALVEVEDGRFFILGGKSGNNVLSDVYELTVNTEEMSGSINAVGNLNNARYGHTATHMPNGNIVIVGGVGADGNTVEGLEIYVAADDEFVEVDLTENEAVDKRDLARFGHSALFLAQYEKDGYTVLENNWEDARVIIYGGFSLTDGVKTYFNIPPTSDAVISVLSVDSEGNVDLLAWSQDAGYKKALSENPHPSVGAAVTQLSYNDTANRHTFALFGGRDNNETGCSNWVEILSFEESDMGGYMFSDFKFGPADPDYVATPFKAGQMDGVPLDKGRMGLTATRMHNGNVLLTGGYQDNNSEPVLQPEIFIPPTHNEFGALFEVQSAY